MTGGASPEVPEVPGSPVRFCARLGRRLRQDGLETLGTSTQTLVEAAVERGDWAVAADLAGYFWDELWRMGQTLHTWLDDLHAYRFERWGTADATARGGRVAVGLRDFNPSSGELARVLDACERRAGHEALEAVERLRLRWVGLHDALVNWVQGLLTSIAEEWGEAAVLESVKGAYARLWAPRYEGWFDMTALERLQLSVEGMRGRMSGPRRRGDVGLLEEEDRYVMSFDPCGSCGVLRRGDPDSGRAPAHPAGNLEPHPWTWGRTGVGWYAVHSPIVMEYLFVSSGKAPLRPLEGCDTAGPCRWFIYKDPERTRPEHYERLGFAPPDRP